MKGQWYPYAMEYYLAIENKYYSAKKRIYDKVDEPRVLLR